MKLVQPVEVEASANWRIRIAFADGVSGELDLSDMAAEPIYAAWRDPDFWRSVHITDHRAVAWNDDIEFCADSLYMDLTGRTLRDMYPRSADGAVNACTLPVPWHRHSHRQPRTQPATLSRRRLSNCYPAT